jgi:hypothetical protein
MNALVKKIADAVLYEGYILYPYRASAVKNRQRFNFGVLAPKAYSAAQNGTENWQMQTEVPVLGDAPEIDLKLRFLHIVEREIFEFDEKTKNFRAVESLDAGEKIIQTWQEAVEREIEVTVDLTKPAGDLKTNFSFSGQDESEMLRDPANKVIGQIRRRRESLKGAIELEIEEQDRKSQIANRKLFKLSVRVSNTTAFEKAENKTRDAALACSLVSAHTILFARGGEFISLLEPPEEFSEAAANCLNIATFPVLAGTRDARNWMLSSPVILYDYPEIAPESAGDLFDGAEIDELLTLRILTLTAGEKREMADLDERARAILERTEKLSAEELLKMHGALRAPEK